MNIEVANLAAEGCRLFPCIPHQKRPLVNDWQNVASDREATLQDWERQFPNCNWGVSTGNGSGIFVVDFDGADGQKAIEQFTLRYGSEWLQTRTAKTPRGVHLWYAWPDDGQTKIRNSAGKIHDGVDVRGEGGYVMVPPSIHPSEYWPRAASNP